MSDHFDIVIVGSGPAGMSAAARAAECGLSHVLLERSAHFCDTIFKYQKGKYVMATPGTLPLRSPLSFAAGIREGVLGTWDKELEAKRVNARFNAEVKSIAGQRGAFRIGLADGGTLEAATVVLAIGLQGNLNKLSVPGAELPFVEYQLDDPEAFADEDIVVIGAGDAGIENALGLIKQNRVVLVNKEGDFSRAKTGNVNLVTKAIESGAMQCVHNAETALIQPGHIVLKTAHGEATFPCDRVIARIGASPPRRFVESCGVKFASSDRTSFPEVSTTYESNVPGLYIIGALAGYPLIKHCMNQGYEVVEYIRGEPVVPADEPLLEEKFAVIPGRPSVNEVLDRIGRTIPLFSGLTRLQLREFLLDSEVLVKSRGEAVFLRNDYGDTLLTILDGSVAVEILPDNPAVTRALGAGEFFGEIGLISGRRRSATVRAETDCVLIEIPRRSATKLINSVPSAKKIMDETVLFRQLRAYLDEDLATEDVRDLVASAKVVPFRFGERLIEEGVRDDSVYVIRSGSVTVSRRIAGRDVVVAYVLAGHLVGEFSLLRNAPHSASVSAASKTEAIKIDAAAFRRVLEHKPALRARIEAKMQQTLLDDVRAVDDSARSGMIEFLVAQGAGEATDVLLIDESLCVRCDNCEKACAETHGGISRLDREAGATFASVHIPTSCRHCEHPHCMADCPPDAIHRALSGEVWIDDTCIGCGNCQRNCPYGVIQMAAMPPAKPGLLQWLLFGSGPGPGEDKTGDASHKGGSKGPKLAVKCDMCMGIDGGPACVRACPTGAAARGDVAQFLALRREAP